MLYKAAYMYQSGAIECGDCIYATSTEDAISMAIARAKCRHADLFGMHIVTGTADDGSDLILPVALPVSPTRNLCA